ncbi:hypothetical protein Acr_16g0002710 [Actinidia rufa]|uniref:Uncharacterized protein n=1 Tax=Actinidia rufa TaxID=165716 RepID=A0A7J0FYW0_9ERIC|nr:hypothetical protein Acr_16g0002710 [Actinidia rufa]
MEVTMGVWLVGVVPVVGWLLWWWNDLWYGFWCGGGGKLPPGHMGVPFFGEIFTFLYYFKLLRRPDDYINSKRQKYGDGVGMYRTHLFRSPAIISCSPSANKFVFQSDDSFILEWPTVEIVGTNSLVAVQGSKHARLRSFVSRAINQPDALRHTALMVQPRVIDALRSWAHKGRIVAYTEAKKETCDDNGAIANPTHPQVLLNMDGVRILVHSLEHLLDSLVEVFACLATHGYKHIVNPLIVGLGLDFWTLPHNNRNPLPHVISVLPHLIHRLSPPSHAKTTSEEGAQWRWCVHCLLGRSWTKGKARRLCGLQEWPARSNMGKKTRWVVGGRDLLSGEGLGIVPAIFGRGGN